MQKSMHPGLCWSNWLKSQHSGVRILSLTSMTLQTSCWLLCHNVFVLLYTFMTVLQAVIIFIHPNPSSVHLKTCLASQTLSVVSVWLWVCTKNLISPHLRANGQRQASCKAVLQCGPHLDCSIWCLQIYVVHLLFAGLLCLCTVFSV